MGVDDICPNYTNDIRVIGKSMCVSVIVEIKVTHTSQLDTKQNKKKTKTRKSLLSVRRKYVFLQNVHCSKCLFSTWCRISSLINFRFFFCFLLFRFILFSACIWIERKHSSVSHCYRHIDGFKMSTHIKTMWETVWCIAANV